MGTIKMGTTARLRTTQTSTRTATAAACGWLCWTRRRRRSPTPPWRGFGGPRRRARQTSSLARRNWPPTSGDCSAWRRRSSAGNGGSSGLPFLSHSSIPASGGWRSPWRATTTPRDNRHQNWERSANQGTRQWGTSRRLPRRVPGRTPGAPHRGRQARASPTRNRALRRLHIPTFVRARRAVAILRTPQQPSPTTGLCPLRHNRPWIRSST